VRQEESIEQISFNEFFSKGINSNIKNVLPELLLIPKKMVYVFAGGSLAQLSMDFLDSELDGTPLAKIQEVYPKKVLSFTGSDLEDSRRNEEMKDYYQVCKNDKYHSIFKASRMDYHHEDCQRRQLQEMLKFANKNDLKKQKMEMKAILFKEELGNKVVPIYTDKFLEIKGILDEQDGTADARQQYLEDKKIRLINEMIDRLG
jgi:hypothetical protein